MLRALPVLMVAPMRVPIIAMIGAIIWGLSGPVNALELREEPMSKAGERMIAQEEPAAGESVGEPSAEDAPVEGEPAAGEEPIVPPDDQPADDAGMTTPDAPKD
ncbi:MAG TPA: hypothetical protein VFX71_06525 [Hyphomicrobium sp.]|jgi:hypothetical protein|nr:hypothetical protein [Hyphomicrobium sp.]